MAGKGAKPTARGGHSGVTATAAVLAVGAMIGIGFLATPRPGPALAEASVSVASADVASADVANVAGTSAADPGAADPAATTSSATDPVNPAATKNPATDPEATPTPSATPQLRVGVCPDVNGFSITIVTGTPSCATINQAARPYTAEVLANHLGRELRWSGEGHSCIRNYDSTGITANAHGLICVGNAHSFLLYYHS